MLRDKLINMLKFSCLLLEDVEKFSTTEGKESQNQVNDLKMLVEGGGEGTVEATI